MRPDAGAGELQQIGDGRRRKGEQRRRELLAATLRVVGREGVAAVTQRAVAREAGLPPSAVLYYFASVDDLLVTALTVVNDRYIGRVEALPDDDDRALAALADLIAAGTGEDRSSAAAEYELWLMAARRPAMRGELERWARTLDRFVGRFTDDPVHRSGITAAIDGLFLRAFSSDGPPAAAQALAILERLVRGR
jgi:DNA-binding transcriptional regulator YbjK